MNCKTTWTEFLKKKKIILGIVIVFIFISIISIYVLNDNKIKIMTNNEIEQAMIKNFNPNVEENIIKQYNTLNNKEKARCDENFKNKIDLLYKYYLDEKIDQNEAIGKMKVLAQANNMSDYEKQIEAKIKKNSHYAYLYQSGESFYKRGLNGEGKGLFELAIDQYKQVDKEYKYYDNAQKKIELATEYSKGEPIQRDEPKIGMTKDEALNSSWGQPKDINKTTTKNGTHEQWVYDNNRYLYFDDNELTAIQE